MIEDNIISIEVAGRSWELMRPADLESLWEAMCDVPGNPEFDVDERLPYWVELWPASMVLADWIFKQQALLRDKVCVDIGCGLGLTAIVASMVGAKVIAFDYEEAALQYAYRNAEHNKVAQPLWTVMDWRRPAIKKSSADFIWGGDIMYEKGFVQPVLDFIEHALAPGGSVWVAEPNRGIFDSFRAEVLARGFSMHKVTHKKVSPHIMHEIKLVVNLWELK